MTTIRDIVNYFPCLISAFGVIVGYWYKSIILRIPVSYPGDPKKRKLMRRGKWPDRESTLPAGWKFFGDKESHDKSISTYPNTTLSGKSVGRQIWYKVDSNVVSELPSFNPNKNPNAGDKIFRKDMIEKWQLKHKTSKTYNVKPSSVGECAEKGIAFYEMLQCSDGHWAGDYGGPMFLMPGLICVLYLTKAPFPAWRKEGMIMYLKNHQQVDGGWGTHIECASTMFGTVLSYVALRLLGESANQPYMKAGRQFILLHGGALYAPSWAKFWLAVLGVYDWKGINSIPAEMWFLPRWFPFHPGKLWCHCRMVYLPMCYVYCKRYTPNVANDVTLTSLRKELYPDGCDYHSIDWDHFRQTCADIDTYSPLNPVMKIAQDFLSYYEYFMERLPLLQSLRKMSLKFVINYIHAEDQQTNYVDIGPVNKALNMLSVWIAAGENSQSREFLKHVPRVDDYLWLAEDGLKMNGYNGSQCWDTCFAIQAIAEGKQCLNFKNCARNVYHYLRETQIANDEEDREFYFRQVSKGGWPFSTSAHGWPISDCTAEGLKSILALHDAGPTLIPHDERISEERLNAAVNVILSLHNPDGGWATYENNRGYGWYEFLNPSEVFGDIMIDYSYVECTSACVTALRAFQRAGYRYRAHEVQRAIRAGKKFILSIQRRDGSWYGSWGVCFTYGTWFGIEGLLAGGEPADSPGVLKAFRYLLSRQNSNGGWGESYVACVDKDYPQDGAGEQCGDQGSGVVQTAWALLGILAVVEEELSGHSAHHVLATEAKDSASRAAKYLTDKQLPSGDWDQGGITGVFNRSCGITYTAYRNVFPIWALLRYSRVYGTI